MSDHLKNLTLHDAQRLIGAMYSDKDRYYAGRERYR